MNECKMRSAFSEENVFAITGISALLLSLELDIISFLMN